MVERYAIKMVANMAPKDHPATRCIFVSGNCARSLKSALGSSAGMARNRFAAWGIDRDARTHAHTHEHTRTHAHTNTNTHTHAHEHTHTHKNQEKRAIHVSLH